MMLLMQSRLMRSGLMRRSCAALASLSFAVLSSSAFSKVQEPDEFESFARAILRLEIQGVVDGESPDAAWMRSAPTPLAETLLARVLARHASRVADPSNIEAWFASLLARDDLADPLLAIAHAAHTALRESHHRSEPQLDLWTEYAAEALLIGPFGDGGPRMLDVPFSPERALGLGFDAPGAFGPVRWRSIQRLPNQRIFTTGLKLYPATGAGYALLRVRSERDFAGYLHLGFADDMRAWWNEEALFDTRSEVQRVTTDEAWLPVVFRAGENRLLLKLEDLAAAGFGVRYLDADARPIELEVIRASERDEDQRARERSTIEAPAPIDRPSTELQRTLNFERSAVLHALRAIELFLDGRASEALRAAVRATELDPEEALAWVLLARLYEGSDYLPPTFKRSRSAEAIERALALDPSDPAARREKALQQLGADRPEDTIEIAEALAREFPNAVEPHHLQRRAFEALQWPRELEVALEAIVLRRPLDASALSALASARARRLDFAGEMEALRAAYALQPTSNELLEELTDALFLAGRSEEALELIENSLQRSPQRVETRLRQAHFLERLNRLKEAATLFAELANEHPADPDYPRWQGDALASAGDIQAALAAWQHSLELEPGQPTVRRILRAHDMPEGEELFERYAEDCLQVAREFDRSQVDRGSSSELLVDLMVERVATDGSRETLTQQLWYLVDEGGVRKHGEPKQARGRTLAIRTIDREGRIHEPLPVRGAYTMPALAPGVFIEHSYVEETEPDRFPTSGFTSFFFASEDQPFRFTRYVLALPQSAPFDLRIENFDGEHEVIEERNEVIHVFTRRNVPRVEPENFSPPREKLLPWVSAQPRIEASALARRIHASFERGSETTQELLSFVERSIRGIEGDAARAEALYTAVQSVVRDPSNTAGNATRTLIEGKGDPLELYVACLRACGIPFRPALVRSVWPELDPDPAGLSNPLLRYGTAILQLMPRDGAARWVSAPAMRLPYGRFAEELEGCEVFLSTGTSGQLDFLPRLAGFAHAQSNAKLEFHLQADGSARVFLDVELANTTGYANAEQVARLAEREQRRVLGNLVNQIVPGLELEGGTFVDIANPKQPLHVRAEGRLKRFASAEVELTSTALGFRPTQLGRGLGSDGERTRPFALPGAGPYSGERFEQVRVIFVPAPGHSLVAAPEPHLERFAGLSYALVVERDGERLMLERTLSMKPCEIPTEEFAAFQKCLERIDRAERQRVLWR